ELEAAPHHLDPVGVLELGQRPLQPPFAEVAPGAHDVRPYVDPHRSLRAHQQVPSEHTGASSVPGITRPGAAGYGVACSSRPVPSGVDGEDRSAGCRGVSITPPGYLLCVTERHVSIPAQ